MKLLLVVSDTMSNGSVVARVGNGEFVGDHLGQQRAEFVSAIVESTVANGSGQFGVVGHAEAGPHGLYQRVAPCLVPLDHPLASVTGAMNAVVAEGNFVGRLFFSGRGAGAGPTASAVEAQRVGEEELTGLGELAPGVELLENLRFDPGETANDPAFVAKLVDGIDGYVNDAFGASHRAHASIVGPPQFVPSAMGRLLQKEVEVLLGLRNKPRHPFVAVLGGAKISDKLGVVEALLEVVDSLVIGGAMCFTFFAAQGKPIGDSLFEPDQVDTCKRLMEEAGAKGKTIHLPDDITGTTADGVYATFGTRLPDGAKGFDIGPGSAAAFTDVIMDARMVFWNGPMGMFEDERFASGTRTVAQAMADTKAFTVVGGGDSAAALAQFKLDDEVDHVSTGGGASLELLENGDLPGLEALRNVRTTR